MLIPSHFLFPFRFYSFGPFASSFRSIRPSIIFLSFSFFHSFVCLFISVPVFSVFPVGLWGFVDVLNLTAYATGLVVGGMAWRLKGSRAPRTVFFLSFPFSLILCIRFLLFCGVRDPLATFVFGVFIQLRFLFSPFFSPIPSFPSLFLFLSIFVVPSFH